MLRVSDCSVGHCKSIGDRITVQLHLLSPALVFDKLKASHAEFIDDGIPATAAVTGFLGLFT